MRRSADGTAAVTFGDPLLDTISSATGNVVVGGRTIELKPLRPGPDTPAHPGSGGVIFDAPALKFMGIVHDAEQWVSEDGSYVEYRIRNGRLGFQAWRRGPSIQDLGAWEMGVQVSVWNTPMKYEAAAVTAINYMTVNAPCQQFVTGELISTSRTSTTLTWS